MTFRMCAMAALLAIAGGSLAALAHEGAHGIVKDRMDLMKDTGKKMKAVAKMLQGKDTYDPAAVKKAAATIKDHAAKIPEHFPKGSLDHPTEAKANIWTHWDQFKRNARRLELYAAALEQNADARAEGAKIPGGAKLDAIPLDAPLPGPSDLATATPAMLFADLARTCKGCHEKFRVKKKEHGHDGHGSHDHHDHDHHDH